MLIEMQKLKEVYERRGLLAKNDPVFSKVLIRVTCKLVHNVNAEADVHGFKLVSDETDEAGGSGKGPLPLDYFLAGLGFCFLSIMARTASSLGVSLDSASFSSRGLLDRRGAYGVSDAYSGFTEITYDLRLTSEESEEKVINLVKEVEKRCPAHTTLRKATTLRGKVYLNERLIGESQESGGRSSTGGERRTGTPFNPRS